MDNSPYEYDPTIQELATEAGMEYHAYVDELIKRLDESAERTRNTRLGIEPEGVDLMIYPPEKPLTEEDFQEISKHIAKAKREYKAMNIIDAKRKGKKKDDKQSSGFVLPNP